MYENIVRECKCFYNEMYLVFEYCLNENIVSECECFHGPDNLGLARITAALVQTFISVTDKINKERFG